MSPGSCWHERGRQPAGRAGRRRARRPRRRQDDADGRRSASSRSASWRYAFVGSAWQGFLASAIVGIGNGLFWPAQSTLLAGLTTQAAALGGLRDAARHDEPRDRDRRRRRRLHRLRELPRALRPRRAHVRRLRGGADRLRPRAGAPRGAGGAHRELPRRLQAPGLHGADGRERPLRRCRDRAARDPARVREERGRRHRARDRLALLRQHDRDRAPPAPDHAPDRRQAPGAAVRR